MDFAKKILNKYGWKEGAGLGKNSDGIAKPLRANLKFDTAGLGADQAASDFNNHWWSRVYNEAAQNVRVERQSAGGVAVALKNADDSVEISTKEYSLKKLRKSKKNGDKSSANYQNFLQSATLAKTGEERENPFKVSEVDIGVSHQRVLTDEELFQACGGRTAHKGARHGLKLSGKLERLERQEQELLARMLAKKTAEEAARLKEEATAEVDISAEDTRELKKKKKRTSQEAPAETPAENGSQKRKKRRKDEPCEEVANKAESSTESSPAEEMEKGSDGVDAAKDSAQPSIKKKKKKKNK